MKKKTRNHPPEVVYYDVDHTGSYGGVKRLNESYVSTLNKTKKWLSTQSTYTLHKPIRKRFPTRPYRVSGINELWQMDLLEMIPYAKVNNEYKYILTCIDVFSRFARAYPTKTKQGEEIANILENMFTKNTPRKIQTDRGREFYNSNVQKLLKKHAISHYTVNSQFKAPHVERFNRTLREKLNRIFTRNGNKVWYKVLPNIIKTYNNTKHRGISYRKPVEVNENNEHELWVEQEKHVKSGSNSKPFKLLDLVRISRISTHQPFIKNFDQNWSEEVFRIVAIDTKAKPTMYLIEDMDHNVIEGKFYKQELQVIGEKPTVFRIEKILRTKGVGKNKQYFVKWYGYDKKHNSWIKASAINK